MFDALIALLTSLLTCIFLVLTQKWHGSISMDTTTGLQKFHTSPTPRIAGIAIAAGVLAGYIASSYYPIDLEKLQILNIMLLAGMPAFIFGLLEDLTKRVSVKIRLLATMASGVIGWLISGISITQVNIWGVDWLLGFTFVSVILTAFAVGGIANAINIIDGFNGLSAGVSLIMLTAFGIIAYEVSDFSLAFTCLIIACAVAGFFFVNWPCGKIFLGDGGAYFLGFMLAWIAILLPARNPHVSAWASLLICFYPIIEVAFSFVRKSVRDGYHPSQPDGVHLHMLLNKRWSRHFFHKLPKYLQNSLTAPFLWIYAAIPCTSAVFFYQNTLQCLLLILLCTFLYLALYNKLAFFRWIKII